MIGGSALRPPMTRSVSDKHDEPNELFQAARPKATFGKAADEKAATKQQRAAAEQMNLTELLGIEGPASSGSGLDFAGASTAAELSDLFQQPAKAPVAAPSAAPKTESKTATKVSPKTEAKTAPEAKPAAARQPAAASAIPVAPAAPPAPRTGWFARLIAWFCR